MNNAECQQNSDILAFPDAAKKIIIYSFSNMDDITKISSMLSIVIL